MEAKEVIRQSKTNLQAILMSNIKFVIQCAFENRLLAYIEYPNLMSSSAPFDAATSLVDTMIYKGETTCKEFLSLLQDTKLTDMFPELKIRVDLMDQLKSDIESREVNMNQYRDVEHIYNDIFQHNKKQVEATEMQIRAEFEKMHQFLREEEEARLAALREEEKKKAETVNREIENIKWKISSLSRNISAFVQELQKHNESFQHSYEHKPKAHPFILSEPQPVSSGLMIDTAKHLGNLTFKVWEKIKERLKFTPVILDPNTASRWTGLSEDLTSMRCLTWFNHGFPRNPERFRNVECVADSSQGYVLGSEGFLSGKHSWEVVVGDHPDWGIGLAEHSVDRTYMGTSDIYTNSGLWLLRFNGVNYLCYGGLYGLSRFITVQRNPQRIRVQLDYDGGKVSFYDPEDMTLIYTIEDGFTEKLYPFFGVGPGRMNNAKTEYLQIMSL